TSLNRGKSYGEWTLFAIKWMRNVVCTPPWGTRSMDETWFYVIADRERVGVFPHEDDGDLAGSPTLQYKSHIPKTMINPANARPDSAH
ncbi:unnamed protein product, partial [Choristocarpus tenellus]